ncbi:MULTISPECIES: response regulator [Methylorubrum]|uniref:response regulator n=1 Tax=Methylorubrum TaxID=2282523 RepID=UPI00209D0CF8|nr:MULTISPECIES: response regulator [Methylorubrum]MDF9864906.1 CheY-like chemotaxis protein [Methylorubrum pseudosasae]MDH6638481.1 CheY-like chemotaxis protein [Methylobacterium sp. SuP10 SLI 274]MDH6667666.1 CheY-like chemotaxis protein [Methylorubrum zatmanii]MCP1559562.1 CheY-like chemotaxis protein [Methylorubrum extorquens]MCY1642543.1 response regulator [Methylorubrum sp. SL192]
MPVSALLNRRILVVEDDYFWADELRHGLEKAGAVVHGPVASVEAALDILDPAIVVDGAILDLGLRGARAYDVAERLIARRTPFVFVTGYDAGAIPEAYAAVPRFEKPVTFDTILRALSALMPPA